MKDTILEIFDSFKDDSKTSNIQEDSGNNYESVFNESNNNFSDSFSDSYGSDFSNDYSGSNNDYNDDDMSDVENDNYDF